MCTLSLPFPAPIHVRFPKTTTADPPIHILMRTPLDPRYKRQTALRPTNLSAARLSSPFRAALDTIFCAQWRGEDRLGVQKCVTPTRGRNAGRRRSSERGARTSTGVVREVSPSYPGAENKKFGDLIPMLKNKKFRNLIPTLNAEERRIKVSPNEYHDESFRDLIAASRVNDIVDRVPTSNRDSFRIRFHIYMPRIKKNRLFNP